MRAKKTPFIAFYCVLALTLTSLLRQLHQHGLDLSLTRMELG